MRHADDEDEPSMTRLKGRAALVTGAQQGIGRAIALAFAHEGADVVINYLDDLKAAERVAADARDTGVRALGSSSGPSASGTSCWTSTSRAPASARKRRRAP